jgi:selenoprotein W-related protein
MSDKPRIEIIYCNRCHWLPRAAWMAQELLWTFDEAVGEVALIPGQDGIFEIRAGNYLVWSRQADGGFPDLKELKQRIRDHVLPHLDLGHSDFRAVP